MRPPRYVQDSHGRFAGSIGAGRDDVPTPSTAPAAGTGAAAPSPRMDYAGMLERMRASEIGRVEMRPPRRPGGLLTRAESLALLEEGEWVGYLDTDAGPAAQVWVNEDTGAVMRMVDGQLHSETAPALVAPDGTQVWYDHGEIHRDGGPAMVLPDGSSRWFNHGASTGSGPGRTLAGFVEPAVNRLLAWLDA